MKLISCLRTSLLETERAVSFWEMMGSPGSHVEDSDGSSFVSLLCVPLGRFFLLLRLVFSLRVSPRCGVGASVCSAVLQMRGRHCGMRSPVLIR